MLNKIAYIFGIPLIAILLFLVVGGVVESGPRGTFNGTMHAVALGSFYLGYAVGAFLTFWLPGALWKSFDYYVGDVWPFIAFCIHPLPGIATAFLFSRPFDAWLY